jgi:hypothetical protein
MKIAVRFSSYLKYKAALYKFRASSFFMSLKARRRRPEITEFRVITGNRILILALYQKGKLRADIIALLKQAKVDGFSVICVNTQRLVPDQETLISNLMDVYIERFNFGRDFGSYKEGFLYFYRKNIDKSCERLLLFNDSVFYSKKGLADFLKQMAETDLEAAGATENHEISHHLGSFCLSFQGSILRSAIFRNYWVNYKLTDVRPAVIKTGEMKLSKVLRKCVSSSEKFGAIYDLNWFADQLYKCSDKCIIKLLDIGRKSTNPPHWQQTSLVTVASEIINNTAPLVKIIKNVLINKGSNYPETLNIYYGKTIVADVCGIASVATTQLVSKFAHGSQIHHNAMELYYLNVPIIKLDVLYRGILTVPDVEAISKMIPIDEMNTFKKLIYSKPFGNLTLQGIDRVAFDRGLI